MDSPIEDADSPPPSSTPYLVYHLNTDSNTDPQENIDIVGFLAIASDLGIPFLPITWQSARDRLGLGGSGDVRQALLDTQTSLAFKLVKDEDKAQRKAEAILRIFANELVALSNPHLCAHPHIVDLLGICWDIAPAGDIWPALVFEKSHFSDLYHFSTLPVWKELKTSERLDLCLQIGSAIAEMHDHDIIHGDIKPQNVLVFKIKGAYVAKVTDFGYSFKFRDDSDTIGLPRSRPWHAPEADRLVRRFSLAEAKRADMFSYAILCFWILFEKDLSGRGGSNLTAKELVTETNNLQKAQQSVQVLESLKRKDLLIKVALELSKEELEAYHGDILMDFFCSALSSDPDSRTETLRTLALLQSYRETIGIKADNAGGVNDMARPFITGRFELSKVLSKLYGLDPRIRSSILECLERRVLGEDKSPELSTDRIQLAICYYIGFGRPRDEEKMLELCDSEIDIALVRSAIESLKNRASSSPVLPPLIQQIYNNGHLGNLVPIETEGNIELFHQWEHTLRRELNDMEISLNDNICNYQITAQLLALLRRQGKFDEAETCQKSLLSLQVCAIGEEHPDVVTGLSNLAWILLGKGELSNALTLQQGVVSIFSRTLGAEHLLTLDAKQNFATILFQVGELDAAEKLEQELREIRNKALGLDHPDTLTSMANLAAIFMKQGKLEEAELLGREVVEIRGKVLGPHHPDTLIAMSNLGLVHQDLGQLNTAEDIQKHVLERIQKVLGDMHPGTLMSMSNLALTYWHQKRLSEAEELGLKVVEARTRVLGDEHPDTLTSVANLALVYKDQDRLGEAVSLEEEVLSRSRRTLGNEHPDTLLSIANLAHSYEAIGAWEKAEQHLEEVFETSKRLYGEDNTTTIESVAKLAIVYCKQGKLDKLEGLGIVAMEPQ